MTDTEIVDLLDSRLTNSPGLPLKPGVPSLDWTVRVAIMKRRERAWSEWARKSRNSPELDSDCVHWRMI